MHKPSELDELFAFSATIGSDLSLIQGTAGNTSIKIDGRLWIKASGKRLADAMRQEVFLPLDLAQLRSAIRQKRAFIADVTNFSGERLTPSIETPMHAVLPHRIVLHVHSVSALARAVRLDAQKDMESRLRGLRWRWIPYVRSGLPLARAIKQLVARPPFFDVLILGNHGLVICGDDCWSVESLLKEVEQRLASTPRKPQQFDREFLLHVAHGSNWQIPEHSCLHNLATDDVSRDILANGILYPCQALILGGLSAWRPFYSGLFCEASRIRDNGFCGRPFLVVRDKGLLVSNRATRTELETLVGLAEVVQRIAPATPIRYLTKVECDELASVHAYPSGRNTDQISLSA